MWNVFRFALKDLCEGAVPNIWGPEMVQFTRVVASNFDEFGERIEEFSLDDVYLYSPRDPPRNAEETMLLELNISEKTIEILYNDFLEHCYPCFSLPVHSFKMYLSKDLRVKSETTLQFYSVTSHILRHLHKPFVLLFFHAWP